MIEAGFPQKRVLAKEHVDFDAVAEQEHSATLATAERLRETGRPKDDEKGTNFVPLSKGGTDRQAAQLAKRRPDLAAAVRARTLKLSKALLEAGIRKPPKPRLTRCPHCGGDL
jgi:hypothetical protein